MADFKLPYGAEFSPDKIKIKEVLKMASSHEGQPSDELVTDLAKKYYKKNHAMASNCKNSMVAYEILETGGGVTLSAFGNELLTMTKEAEIYDAMAKRILTHLSGLMFIEAIRTISQGGNRPTLESMTEKLNLMGCEELSKTNKHVATMKKWLEKAKVLNGWEIKEKKLESLIGVKEADIKVLRGLTREQACFIKALCNTGSDDYQNASKIRDLATASYNVDFPAKNFANAIIKPLEDKKLIEKKPSASSHGGNSSEIKLEPTVKAEVLASVLEQIEIIAGKEVLLYCQKSLEEDNETDYERVTFHPDYSYANFVGTYKPVPFIDSEGKDAITYEYVPGPFMRVYVNALKSGRTDSPKPYLLIIEEINRANVAAVFGDVFQLLDRDNRQVSEYPIQASEDIKKYLAKKLGGELDNYSKIRIPNNMFIWATMNSADQGVFPMDTAFKRRWDFTYIGINDNDDDLKGKTVEVGSKIAQRVEWNKLRMAINDFLAKQKINEDKQLGPYFISRDIVVPDGPEIDKKRFADVFKSKVIMYLFEDAAKQKRATLFEGCFQNSSRYSEICKEFDEHGIGIFNHDIVLAADPEDTAGPLAGTMPENE